MSILFKILINITLMFYFISCSHAIQKEKSQSSLNPPPSNELRFTTIGTNPIKSPQDGEYQNKKKNNYYLYEK